MAAGFLAKLLLIFLVILIVWRGVRIWKDVQQKLADAEAERRRQRSARAPLELVPCRSCGTYVPSGTACPSCGEAAGRRA